MIFIMAEVPHPRFPGMDEGADSIATDSVIPDTVGMDSLQLAIWKRNKAVDDSLYADSLNRQRKNGIDAPVVYSAEDSMTYEASTGLAHLYGRSHVKYENMDLESDQIYTLFDHRTQNL